MNSMHQVLQASSNARALVTAVLPVVVYGTRQGEVSQFDFAHTLTRMESDPDYVECREQVLMSLQALGLRPDDVSDLTSLMSAVHTSIFIVHFADLEGVDPAKVWRHFVDTLVDAECVQEE